MDFNTDNFVKLMTELLIRDQWWEKSINAPNWLLKIEEAYVNDAADRAS